MKNLIKTTFRTMAPTPYFVDYYRRALAKLGDTGPQAHTLFTRLVDESSGFDCLQIGFKEGTGDRYAEHWHCNDLYDFRPQVTHHYDIMDLGFPAASYDVVVCISILEHVPDPYKAVAELVRVLRPGGLLWLQSPLAYPYHESPKDYWRFAPDGLRALVAPHGLQEIACGAFRFSGSALAVSSSLVREDLVISNTVRIAITEIESEIEQAPGDLEAKLRAAMIAARKSSWCRTDDERFRAAVGAVMLHYGLGSPEYLRLKEEMEWIQQASALLQAAMVGEQVALPELTEDYEPIGLIGMWG